MILNKVCPKCEYDTYVIADLIWDIETQGWRIADMNYEVNCPQCGHTYKVTEAKNIER
jgi:ribosomal protein S27AE